MNGDQTLSYKTRANHFKNRIAVGGHLWLREGLHPELVFRAHGIFQRRYELRLPLSKVESFIGDTGGALIGSRWALRLTDGTTEEFVVAGRTGLREALQSARTNVESASIATGAQSGLPRFNPAQPAPPVEGDSFTHVRQVETAPKRASLDSGLRLRAPITATPQLPGFKYLGVIGYSTALKRFAQAVPRNEWGYGLDIEGAVIIWESRAGLVSESQDGVYEPVRLPARRLAIPAKVVQLVGSRNEMFALTEEGDVWAWGEHYFNQIGHEERDEESPLQIKDLAGVVSLASNGNTHFAIGAQGEVWSWGSAYGGRLGDGSEADRSVPTLIPHLTDVTEIRCSEDEDRVVALSTHGSVFVWGYGYTFEGDHVARSVPAQLTGLPTIHALGEGDTAIDSEGRVWSWIEDLVVSQVPVLTDIISVVHGGNWIHNDNTWHAVTRDGHAYGWGCNNFGQIGDGTTIDRDQPVPVTGLTGVVALVAHGAEVYALASSGTVYAWGGFPTERALEEYGSMAPTLDPAPRQLPLPPFTESTTLQRWVTLDLVSLGSSELRQTFFDFRDGRTPLMACSAAGLDDEVSIMLTQSGNVDAADAEGDSALFYAASKGQVRNVELLLRAGADPNNHRRTGGHSPLAQAAEMSVASGGSEGVYWRVALLLLRAGADPADMYSRGIVPTRYTDRGILLIRQEHLRQYLAYDDIIPARDLRGDLT